MLVVDTANPAQLLGRRLVVEVADQRIARVGGNCGDTTVVQDLRRLFEQPLLRMGRVDFEVLGHAPIVGARADSGRSVDSRLERFPDR